MVVKTFLTADPHFGHNNILKYCKRLEFLADDERRKLEDFSRCLERLGSLTDGTPEFKECRSQLGKLDFRPSDESVQRMNAAVFGSINRTVGVDDTLWILGDFCFAPSHSRIETAKRYSENIHCRNVNLVWGNHDDRGIAPFFSATYDLVRTTVYSQRVVLCHFPLAVWDNSYRGDWMMYGHCHTTAEVWLESIMPQRKSMDVGIDNAKKLLGEYRPFSFDEVASFMRQRVGHTVFRKRRSGDEMPGG